MKSQNYSELPLVYSCSGCSNMAQLANRVAVEMDRDRVAEMSCIAGVGGGVAPLVRKAASGRQIIAIDGCPLHCVKQCLSLHGVEASLHYTLTEHGLKKQQHVDYLPSDVKQVKARIVKELKMSVAEASAS